MASTSTGSLWALAGHWLRFGGKMFEAVRPCSLDGSRASSGCEGLVNLGDVARALLVHAVYVFDPRKPG
jgi:hypothetical protein